MLSCSFESLSLKKNQKTKPQTSGFCAHSDLCIYKVWIVGPVAHLNYSPFWFLMLYTLCKHMLYSFNYFNRILPMFGELTWGGSFATSFSEQEVIIKAAITADTPKQQFPENWEPQMCDGSVSRPSCCFQAVIVKDT